MWYLHLTTGDHQELSLLEWELVKADIEEFLSTSRNHHTIEFDIEVIEV